MHSTFDLAMNMFFVDEDSTGARIFGSFVLLSHGFFFKKRILGMFWGPGKSEVLGKIHAMFGFDPWNVKSFPVFCLWVWVLDPFCLERRKKKKRKVGTFVFSPFVLVSYQEARPVGFGLSPFWTLRVVQNFPKKKCFFFHLYNVFNKHVLNDFLTVLFYWFFLFCQIKS